MDPLFGHVFIYEHCLPFDVSRAYDEARGIKPANRTAERDRKCGPRASLKALRSVVVRRRQPAASRTTELPGGLLSSLDRVSR